MASMRRKLGMQLRRSLQTIAQMEAGSKRKEVDTGVRPETPIPDTSCCCQPANLVSRVRVSDPFRPCKPSHRKGT